MIKRETADTVCEVLPGLWLRKYLDGTWVGTPVLEEAAFMPKSMLEEIFRNEIPKDLKDAVSAVEGFPRYHTAIRSIELPYYEEKK